MASSTFAPSSTPASEEWNDPRVDVTVNAVNWDALLHIACRHNGVQNAQWGEQRSGGYNLVRFLHLDDDHKKTIVARVPLHPVEGATPELIREYGTRLASEVATMQYIEAHTPIPVPHVIHYSADADTNGVRSPFIIMSEVVGTRLFDVWDDMPDEHRDIILRQVVDIYLELASHRFDQIGALLRSEGNENGALQWDIHPLSTVTEPNDLSSSREVSNVTYSSGTDYWIALVNAHLRRISEDDFGSRMKLHEYAQMWFMRSLIPSLYNPSLDASGFPLVPGDFHSQNILISDATTSPKITAVIDWEFSSTVCTSSFAQYPLFIVDHPAWEEDHAMRPRNIRDQATFNAFILEAERRRDPDGGQPISRAFASCKGVYLFEQCVQNPVMFSELYPQLFAHVFGDEEEFSGDYYWALMEHGMLKKQTKQFELESEVWEEARSVLGDELGEDSVTRADFIKIAKEHRSRFSESGKVIDWLESLE